MLKRIIKKNEFIFNSCLNLLFIVRKFKIKYFYIETLKKDFEKQLGYSLNLDAPKTFNEKLQWLKVNYRDPIMTECADKVAVRDRITKEIGEGYLIDVYGVYNSVEEIDVSKLPKEFVLKPNHSSGRVIICKDKNAENWKENFKLLKKWVKENYYYQNGEWVYKDIKPKIICEKLLDDNIIDYKFYCFNGRPEFLYLSQGLGESHKTARMNFIDLKWNKTQYQRTDFDEFILLPKKPENFNQMIMISQLLSKRFPFVRVDLFEVEGKIFFSELTFFPGNGMMPFEPIEWDRKLGDMLDLSNI